jgi:hypothetical protein
MTVTLPTQRTKPTTDLAKQSILLYGIPKTGKCLAAGTTLYDPGTGQPTTLSCLVEEQNGDVLSMGMAGVLAAASPSDYIENPADQLYRVTTQTGRVIEATAAHPFLTRTGWVPLKLLTENDRVAVVAEYPSLFGRVHTEHAFIKILAYLLADGSLGGTSPVFTKMDAEVREDFLQAVEAVGDGFLEYDNERGMRHVRVKGKRVGRNNVLRFLREHGLHGLRSADKFIPNFVFGLKKERLALFLNRLFSCDGSIEKKQVSYSSTSIRLVRQVQHLLLRFGIISVIRDRLIEDELYGAELYVAGKDDILRFLDEIGVYGEKQVAAEQLRQSLYSIRCSGTQLDRHGNILFDRIRSIEPTEIAPVYDLTVPGTHNFVASDFVVHNSSFASRFPDAIFLECEPGLNHLEVFKVPIQNWDSFLAACKLIAQGDHPFKTVVIDTVDNAFKFCSDHVCAKHNIEYEGDMGHGKGWALVKNEWHRVLTRLASLPYGLVLISHAQDKTIETRTGEYTKTQPSLPDRARGVVLGLVDMILYGDAIPRKDAAGNVTIERVIRTKPHPTYEAGDRTGRLPDILPLDYDTFVAAFHSAAPGSVPGTGTVAERTKPGSNGKAKS